ncbi:hypothetical protein Tco_0685052 [Tanacetum coccineum]
MEPDIENMTLNEYLMYQGMYRNLERSCTSRNRIACSKVAPVMYKNLVYPDFDEEDEEYSMLPPLPPCFQTPRPCTKINYISHNVENEIDIHSLTLAEYDVYMTIQCLMKSDVHDMTHGFTPWFFDQSPQTPNPPLDKKDFSFEEIINDLFRIGGENLISMEHEEVPNRCDEETVGDTDLETGNLLNFPTFFVTNEIPSDCIQEEENLM